MQKRGKLFILVGPPSVGKNTLMDGVCESLNDLIRMPSATTRMPRVGEKNAIDKFFITEKEFDEKISQGDFLEWQVIHGAKYGVLKSVIENRINAGKNYIADIEVLGAMELKKQYKEDVNLIFVIPPSLEAIETRIKSRGTETEEEVKLRLHRSRAELTFLPKCDQVLLNDNLQEAIIQLKQILIEEKTDSLNSISEVIIESVGFVARNDGESFLIKFIKGEKRVFDTIVSKGEYPHEKLVEEIKKIIPSIAVIDDGELTRKYNKGLDVLQPIWVSFNSIKGRAKIKFYYVLNSINCPKLEAEYQWLPLEKIDTCIEDESKIVIVKKIKNFILSK